MTTTTAPNTTTATTWPAATPGAMALLAGMLADHAVELRVSPGGELQLRDRAGRLSPDDRRLVHHYRDALADWLTERDTLPQPSDERIEETDAQDDPTTPRCDRCERTEFIEVTIHNGASTRRDCARCGRTWGFPVWYGEA